MAEDSEEGGFNNWRLPTPTDLETVAANGGQAHFEYGGTLWSSTKQGNKAWIVNLTTGEFLLI